MASKKHPMTAPYDAYREAVNAYKDAIYPVTRLRDDLQRLREQYEALPKRRDDYLAWMIEARGHQNETMENAWARNLDRTQAEIDGGIDAYLGEHPARLFKAEAEAWGECPALFEVVLSRARAVAELLGKEFTHPGALEIGVYHLDRFNPQLQLFDRFDLKQIAALVVTSDGLTLDDLSKAAFYAINEKKIKKQQARENVKPLDLRPVLQAREDGTYRVEPADLLHALEVRDEDGRMVLTANDFLAIDQAMAENEKPARALRVGMLRDWLKLAEEDITLALAADGLKLNAGVTRARFKWLDMRHQKITGKIILPTFIGQAPPEVTA